MSQTNYSVQRTFISFDDKSDQITRKRSNTWDGAMSDGSREKDDEADVCQTSTRSTGSVVDEAFSDGTLDTYVVEADAEDTQAAFFVPMQKADTETASLPLTRIVRPDQWADVEDPVEDVQVASITSARVESQSTLSTQKAQHSQAIVPADQGGSGTWSSSAQNQNNSNTVYCMLPPITVKMSDMPQGFVPPPQGQAFMHSSQAQGLPQGYMPSPQGQGYMPSPHGYMPSPYQFQGAHMHPAMMNMPHMTSEQAAAAWAASGKKKPPAQAAKQEKGLGAYWSAKANVTPEFRNKYGKVLTHSPLAESTGMVSESRHAAGKESEHTTIMLRNIPNEYTRDMLLELLNSEGFVGLYDFVYLPVDFQRWAGLGYAFVNLVSHEDAECARAHFHGFTAWMVRSTKVCEAAWSGPLQGFTEHCERYRNSPVMHELVPEYVKPIIFQGGQRIPFPEPTRRVWPPGTMRYPTRWRGGAQRAV